VVVVGLGAGAGAQGFPESCKTRQRKGARGKTPHRGRHLDLPPKTKTKTKTKTTNKKKALLCFFFFLIGQLFVVFVFELF
jgi:hypothetical protein